MSATPAKISTWLIKTHCTRTLHPSASFHCKSQHFKQTTKCFQLPRNDFNSHAFHSPGLYIWFIPSPTHTQNPYRCRGRAIIHRRIVGVVYRLSHPYHAALWARWFRFRYYIMVFTAIIALSLIGHKTKAIMNFQLFLLFFSLFWWIMWMCLCRLSVFTRVLGVPVCRCVCVYVEVSTIFHLKRKYKTFFSPRHVWTKTFRKLYGCKRKLGTGGRGCARKPSPRTLPLHVTWLFLSHNRAHKLKHSCLSAYTMHSNVCHYYYYVSSFRPLYSRSLVRCAG